MSGEFQSLFDLYVNDNSSQKYAFQTAFSTVYSGWFASEVARNQGRGAWLWSSTWYNDSLEHYMFTSRSSNSGTITGGEARRNGLSIRCILAQ